MSQVTLYAKAGCRLCDVAIELLKQFNLSLTITDIESQEELMDRYGLFIPVALFENGTSLNWPFDAVAIQSQLSA
ncbi:MAG: glutaredoxin family protein [Gammaproteobacteria bacterium]|nr:glutaredoxin family protein [Gammaproteobacteria bacterium]